MKVNKEALDSASRIPVVNIVIGSMGFGRNFVKLLKHAGEMVVNGAKLTNSYVKLHRGSNEKNILLAMKCIQEESSKYKETANTQSKLKKKISKDIEGLAVNLARISWIGAFILHGKNVENAEKERESQVLDEIDQIFSEAESDELLDSRARDFWA